MGLLKTIIEQVQAQSYGTPGTPEKTAGVPAKPNTGAAWAPGTPGTPQNRYDGKAIMETPIPAANDPTMADWKTLDRAYLTHHAQCHQCRSAGRGYGQRCGTGAALWRSYEAAPTPFDKKPKPVRNPVQQQAIPPDMADLLQAAMLACDFWGDGVKDREAMRQHCLTVPVHQRRDLMAYFVEHYGEHSHD